MRAAGRKPAPIQLQSRWQTRRVALRQSLDQAPEDRWSWLWGVRLRVCDFMLRRYGDEGEREHAPLDGPADAATTDDVATLPESPEPFSTTQAAWREVPAVELERRRRARERFRTTLEHFDAVAETVESESARQAEEHARRSARTAVANVYATRVSQFVLTIVAGILGIGVLIAVGGAIGIPILSELTKSLPEMYQTMPTEILVVALVMLMIAGIGFIAAAVAWAISAGRTRSKAGRS